MDGSNFIETEQMTITRILTEMENLLPSPRYWIKGDMFSVDGKRMCLAGALRSAMGMVMNVTEPTDWWKSSIDSLEVTCLIQRLLIEVILELYPKQSEYLMYGGPPSMCSFNDHPKTKHRHVIEVIRRARAIHEGDHP